MAEVRLDQTALNALLRSPAGPVGMFLLNEGRILTNEAKQAAPVDEGRLRASISERLVPQGQNLAVEVVAASKYACVLGGQASVMTSTGLRTIGQIRPGEFVLTQTGEFHEVLAASSFLVKHKPDLVDIAVPWRKGKDHRLTVTADHRLLVERDGALRWVCAGDLRLTDGLQVRRKVPILSGSRSVADGRCENCGSPTRQTLSRPRRYCSVSCRDEHWAKGNDPKIGRARGAEFSQRHSERRKALYALHPDKHPNRSRARTGKQTEPERMVGEWLTGRGIQFETQAPIAGFFVDFWCAEENLIVEADGAYWHQDQSVDIQRDLALQAAKPGVRVLHLHFAHPRWTAPYGIDPEPAPGVSYEVCNPTPGSYRERAVFESRQPTLLRSWTWSRANLANLGRASAPRLYDLAVEGQHSFVANGILISNSAVHNGTKPHFPPVIALSGWTRRHGGGSAFLVARAISQRGTKGRPFLSGPLLRRYPGARIWATIR